MHHKYNNVFTGVECLKGTFSLQIKKSTKSNHALPRHAVCALQDPFKKELEHLQQQDI